MCVWGTEPMQNRANAEATSNDSSRAFWIGKVRLQGNIKKKLSKWGIVSFISGGPRFHTDCSVFQQGSDRVQRSPVVPLVYLKTDKPVTKLNQGPMSQSLEIHTIRTKDMLAMPYHMASQPSVDPLSCNRFPRRKAEAQAVSHGVLDGTVIRQAFPHCGVPHGVENIIINPRDPMPMTFKCPVLLWHIG